MAYLPLSTANLPNPVIDPAQGASPEDHFGTLIWSGNDTGTTRTIAEGQSGITGDVNFTPDFIWAKARSSAYSHVLYDTVRGLGANKELNSDQNSSEGSGNPDTYGYASSVTTGGFITTAGSNGPTDNLYFNNSGDTYVAWNWKANGSGSTIAVDTYSAGSPSIASTVSANTTSGFSIVKYTGTNDTTNKVAHGLDQKPEVILLKKLTASTDWVVYHESVCTDDRHFLYLNTTAALTTGGATRWDISAFDADTFTVGDDHSVNASGEDYIAYCFHSVEGYSKFSSYVGNGSTNGPFVYTGFRPSMIMVKASSTTSHWYILDDERNTYNAVDAFIKPNSSNAEATSLPFDFTSNGFKIRTSSAGPNSSGATYIYMAFAENPFKYSNAR